MLSQASWQIPDREINPLEFLNLPRYIMQWLNGRRMDNYIGAELDKRFRAYRENHVDTTSRSVIDLVLQAYLDDSATKQSRGKRDATELDAGFRAFAISRVRLFLFVGHDSMSSTIYYTLHLLSSKPKHLVVPDSVRARHRTGKRYFRFSSITPGGATAASWIVTLYKCRHQGGRSGFLSRQVSGIRQGARGVELRWRGWMHDTQRRTP